MMAIALVLIGILLGSLATLMLRPGARRPRRSVQFRLQEMLDEMEQKYRLRLLTDDLQRLTQPGYLAEARPSEEVFNIPQY
jgi:hypothetical protein